MKTKICIISSSRADYGLLKNLIKTIEKSEKFFLQFIVTGSHLSNKHGSTIQEITDDKVKIDKTVNILKKKNTNKDIGLTVGHSVQKFVKVMSELSPDITLILGDRYEIFSAAISSAFLQIPIAHIHGGEITEGAIDDNLRHAITKLEQVHFVSTETYRKRVIQMGEQQGQVYKVGSLGVENLKSTKLLPKNKVEDILLFKFLKRNIIVTYHPVTLDKDPAKGIDILLKVLSKFPEIGKIFTYANADVLGYEITKKIKKFVIEDKNSKVFSNLGQINFFSCLKYCDGIVGNSSSGIIEASSLKKWSLNIGNRQKGRLKPCCVFDVKLKEEDIFKKLRFLLKNKDSTKNLSYKNPYFKKNTSLNIVKKLELFNTKEISRKKFFDINNIF